MNKYEKKLEDEREHYESAVREILDQLECKVVELLHERGNFMMVPRDVDISVRIVDGSQRDELYNVYAVGLTTSDDVIYVTHEALYDEWDHSDNEEGRNDDGSFTETFVKKSKYWWGFDDCTHKKYVLSNKANVLNNVYNILTENDNENRQ